MALQIDGNFRRQDHSLNGTLPAVWSGIVTLDGTAGDWFAAGVGSIYVLLDVTNKQLVATYQKREANGTTADWAMLGGSGVVSQTVDVSEFTDGAGATGTLTLDQQIPAGAFVLRSIVTVTTGVDGTSTVLTIGDGTDADRYNTSTIDVSSAAVLDGGAISGTAVTATASDVVLTLTEDDDFGDVTEGAFTVKVFYMA